MPPSLCPHCSPGPTLFQIFSSSCPSFNLPVLLLHSLKAESSTPYPMWPCMIHFATTEFPRLHYDNPWTMLLSLSEHAPKESVLLLLLLSRFSRVRLCATPETAAHQAPPSLGVSRQEHWSGVPFPSPMRESESESEVAQLRLTLSDPIDCSLPGSSVHGIFQARVLEWGAIAFSERKHK